MYVLYFQFFIRRVRILVFQSYCLFIYIFVYYFLFDQTANMRRYMVRVLMALVMGIVFIQVRMMFLKSFQFTFCLDLIRFIDIIELILQWVVLIGIFTLDVRRIVKVELILMQNLLKIEYNFVIIKLKFIQSIVFIVVVYRFFEIV